MKPRCSATGLLLAISLLWGSSWIANQILSEQGAPLRTATLRYLYASVCLALAHAVRLLVKRLRQSPVRTASTPGQRFTLLRALVQAGAGRGWLDINIVLGVTIFALPDLLLLWAAHHGAAPWTPLIYAGLPLGLLLAAGELRRSAILGVGAMLVVLNGSLPITAVKLGWALLIVAAVALQGWSLLYARRHIAVVSTLLGVSVQLLTAGWLLQIALILGFEPAGDIPLRGWPASALVAMSLLALLGTAIAYPLYYRLLAHFEPAQLAVSGWLQTLVGVGESAVLLRQRPGWPMICAAAVLALCTVLLLRGDSEELALAQPV